MPKVHSANQLNVTRASPLGWDLGSLVPRLLFGWREKYGLGTRLGSGVQDHRQVSAQFVRYIIGNARSIN